MQRKNMALKIAALVSSLTLLVGFVTLQAIGSLPWPFGSRGHEPAAEQPQPSTAPASAGQSAGSPQPEGSVPQLPWLSPKEIMSSSKSIMVLPPVDSGDFVIEEDNSTPASVPALTPAAPTGLPAPNAPPAPTFDNVAREIAGGMPAPNGPRAQTGPPAPNAPSQQKAAEQKPAQPRKVIMHGSKAPASLGDR